MCGARPIVYDNANYRKWFDGLAIFMPESTQTDLVERLEKLWILPPENPVTKIEKEWVKYRFNWEDIVTGFWNKL